MVVHGAEYAGSLGGLLLVGQRVECNNRGGLLWEDGVDGRVEVTDYCSVRGSRGGSFEEAFLDAVDGALDVKWSLWYELEGSFCSRVRPAGAILGLHYQGVRCRADSLVAVLHSSDTRTSNRDAAVPGQRSVKEARQALRSVYVSSLP